MNEVLESIVNSVANVSNRIERGLDSRGSGVELNSGYRETEIGVIPDSWEVLSLIEIADHKKALFDDGDWVEAEHITNEGYTRLIQTGNIGIGCYLEKESKKYIFEESFEKLQCKELNVGDILICRLAEPAGRACIFPDISEGRVITSVDVTILRPSANKTDRNFLVQYFSTRDWFESVLNNVGGTTHKRISRGSLGAISVPFPPIQEQRAIAEALSDVDKLLDSLDALIAKKRAIKQATMQQLLTGKTRLPGFSSAWETRAIRNIAECIAGGTPSTSVPEYWNGTIRWMSSGELNKKLVKDVDGRITKKGLRESSARLVPPRCVLVGLAGQGKTRGTVAISFIELCTNQSIAAILPNDSFIPEYLYFNLDSRYDELRGMSTGDGGRGGLNLRIIRSINIPFPEIDEQRAIAVVLTDMDSEITSLYDRRDKTRAIKEGMMQQLLTGRVRFVEPGRQLVHEQVSP